MPNPLPESSVNDLHARLRAAEMAANIDRDYEDAGLIERALAFATLFQIDAEDMGVDPVEAFKQILSVDQEPA